MNKSFYCLIFLFLLTGIVGYAQTKAPVSATVDRNKIFIGEQFDLILDMRASTATTGFFALDSLPHFEIINKSKIDTTAVGIDTLLSQRITLTSWDSGRWQLPSFSVAGMRAKTNPIAIDVTYSPMDPKQDYHDVKDILAIEKPVSSNWYWYLAGLVLLIGLLLLLFPGKKKQAPEVTTNPDAYKIAIAGLQKLRKEGAAKDAKTFYVDLVDVFRKYLQDRKGLQSLSKTTDDLSQQIKTLNLPSDVYKPLVQTLQLSDAVKFARLVPTDRENKQSLDVIHKSIEAIEKA